MNKQFQKDRILYRNRYNEVDDKLPIGEIRHRHAAGEGVG